MTRPAGVTGGNGDGGMPGLVPPTIDERDTSLSVLAQSVLAQSVLAQSVLAQQRSAGADGRPARGRE
jgi:hypothetical protein